MIFSTLEKSDRYSLVHSRFAAAFKFLRALAPDVPDGRVEIDGDRLFALVQSYKTTPAAERKLEHHRKYADIQFMFAGEEVIEHAPLGRLRVDTAYDEGKDFGLVADPAMRSAVKLEPGQLVILFPEDAHKAGCATGSPAAVRKVVLKVLL